MELVNDFLYYDEEATDPDISPDIISIADDLLPAYKIKASVKLWKMIYLPTDIPILPDTSPPTTTKALHALTTLNKYFEALPVSSLQHPTTMHNTSEVSDIVSSLQTIALSLKSYQLNNQQQQTLHGWLLLGSSSQLAQGEGSA